MSWVEVLENPEAINSVFDGPPLLDEVDLVSVVLERDGPTVILAVALKRTPDKPSPKWQRMGANAVALKLQLLAVENLSIEGLLEPKKPKEVSLTESRRGQPDGSS